MDEPFEVVGPWLKKQISEQRELNDLASKLSRKSEEYTQVRLKALKGLRRMFLEYNRQLIKGDIIRHRLIGPTLMATVHTKATEFVDEINDEQRYKKKGKRTVLLRYKNDFLKTTLKKTVKLYRDQVKLWYGCSLNQVPLDVNHIIVSYLVGTP